MTQMKYIFTSLALLALSGQAAASDDSYLYLKLGVGSNDNVTGEVDWQDGNGVGARFEVGYTAMIAAPTPTVEVWTELNWTHLSQYDVGPPWNDNRGPESTVDHFGVAIELRFY